MGAIRVGLKDLYYATLTDDGVTTPGTATYGTPVKVAGAITAKISPKTDLAVQYADDGAAEVGTALGEIDLELNITDIPLAVQAAWLGHTVANGVIVKNQDDVSPYVAIGFRSMKSNGKYRYVWLYKGKFAEIEEDFETKADKVKFQTPTIKATFLRRDCDGNWEAIGDEDETGFTAGATWFNTVYEQPVV